MHVKVINLHLDNYSFENGENPYIESSTLEATPLEIIANRITTEINALTNQEETYLVRGIQSGKHPETKDSLIARITETGRDFENTDNSNSMFAALYEGAETILHILQGFHIYKPKSNEVPHYPVDLWLVYNRKAYENVEYLHPRHNVIAHDKWDRKDPLISGLIGMVSII